MYVWMDGWIDCYMFYVWIYSLHRGAPNTGTGSAVVAICLSWRLMDLPTRRDSLY